MYDATNRTWMAMDPIKDGLNWYQYCLSNPTTNWDPTGLASGNYFATYSGCNGALLGDTIISALERLIQDSKDNYGTASIGLSFMISNGIFGYNISINLVGDNQGNFAIQASIGTAISPGEGISVNGTATVTNAPTVDSLNGMGYSIGGSAYAGYGGGVDFVVVPKANENGAYYGLQGGIGFGAGAEGHVNMSNTWTLAQINIYDFLLQGAKFAFGE